MRLNLLACCVVQKDQPLNRPDQPGIDCVEVDPFPALPYLLRPSELRSLEKSPKLTSSAKATSLNTSNG